MAIGLSGLCLVHCLRPPSCSACCVGRRHARAPIIHEVGLTLAMIMGAIALGRGILEHGYHDAERGRRPRPRRDGRRADPSARRHRGALHGGRRRRSWRSATGSTASPPNSGADFEPLAAHPGDYFPCHGAPRSSSSSRASAQGRARERLTERGEQWTDMRAAVFEALAGFDRPASAYDIAEAVSKARRGGGSPPTASIGSSTCSSAPTSPAGRERQRLCRQPASRLPARLHLPDLRHLRAGDAHRRRHAVRRRPRGGGDAGFSASARSSRSAAPAATAAKPEPARPMISSPA